MGRNPMSQRVARSWGVLIITVAFWIGFAIASTHGGGGRIECYEKATWAKMDRQWHSHGEYVCFEN